MENVGRSVTSDCGTNQVPVGKIKIEYVEICFCSLVKCTQVFAVTFPPAGVVLSFVIGE